MQTLRILSGLILAAMMMIGCSSVQSTETIAADTTDSGVFAALFASHPGLGVKSVVTLDPATSNAAWLAEALPAGVQFSRAERHSPATFAGLNLALSTHRQLASAYKGGAFTDLQHWKPFQREFPGFNSILSLSHAYVSGNTAAVYVEEYCGGLCGIGDVYLFERTENSWQFVNVIEIWIS